MKYAMKIVYPWYASISIDEQAQPRRRETNSGRNGNNSVFSRTRFVVLKGITIEKECDRDPESPATWGLPRLILENPSYFAGYKKILSYWTLLLVSRDQGL